MTASYNYDEIFVREALECPICKDFFVEPKQLACGHTFCQNCIEHLDKVPQFGHRADYTGDFIGYGVRYAIHCPQCRELCTIPQLGLSTNYVVKEMAEKFRAIGLSQNSGQTEGCSLKMSCDSCSRNTPIMEMFMCKTCKEMHRPSKKFFLCSFCIMTQGHKDHDVVITSDLATKRDRDQASNNVEMFEKQAKLKLDQMKIHATEIPREFEQTYKKLVEKLPFFNKLQMDCMDDDNMMMKQDLENPVKEAKQFAERVDQICLAFRTIKKEIIGNLALLNTEINSLPSLANSSSSQDLIDFGGGPSSSSNLPHPAFPQSLLSPENCFIYNINELDKKRRALHKRKPRRVCHTVNDDDSSTSTVVLD